MKSLLALAALLLAPAAHADDMLGFRLSFGQLALRDTDPISATGLGLGIEHPLCGKLRLLGEYELLWITNNPDEPSRDFIHTMGHRGHVGVRRELGSIYNLLYADIETGIGLGVYDTIAATHVAPHAFAGLRIGYHIPDDFDRPRKARAFETEVMFRVLALQHDVGMMGGFGFYWGD